MKVLIRRELDSMVYSWQEAFRVYTLVGIGYILVMWILGPRIAGVIDAEQSSLLISIFGFTIAGGRMTVSLERDKKKQQQTFLQTLPIYKTHIVHAKFLSILFLCAFTFVWISVFIIVNVFVNGGEMRYWIMALLMASMFFFITGMTLLCYFLWGHRRIGLIFYSTLAVWTMAFMTMVFTMKSSDISFSRLLGLALLVTAVIYFVCWWVAVCSVNKRGLPQETSSDDESNDWFGFEKGRSDNEEKE